MKGIILAGGSGSRLYPITLGVSKQLLPVYDKPMIYYPLSTLMLAGINEILIITTPEDNEAFKRLLGNGEQFGVEISYEIQPRPEGLAQAFLIGEKFIGEDSVCLVLGDNIFFGQGLGEILSEAAAAPGGATIFGYKVNDPERFGVVTFNNKKEVVEIVEKPQHPRSNYAITGLYFYDNSVVEKAKSLLPSSRGELEITDINQLYLKEGELKVQLFGRGFAWLDTGTNESLLEASSFVQTVQKRQGLKIACLEEIGYLKGWLGCERLVAASVRYGKNEYGTYVGSLLHDQEGE